MEEQTSRPTLLPSAGAAPQTQARPRQEWQFAGQTVRVLFLCVNNSARSQIAEALVRKLSQGQVEASSAGSSPAPTLHPDAVRIMTRLGVDIRQYAPKHLDLFRDHSFDRIVVMSDREREEIPHLPDGSQLVFWSIPDPATSKETPEERARVFEHLAVELTTRVRLLLTLLEREKREQRQQQTDEAAIS